MALASNILIITACIFSVAAAVATLRLTRRRRNNSRDMLVLRARAVAAGVAALFLAALGAALGGSDIQLRIGAAVIMVIAVATLVQAGTHNMYAR